MDVERVKVVHVRSKSPLCGGERIDSLANVPNVEWLLIDDKLSDRRLESR